MVYATARRVTGDGAAAEDVSQDSFLRLAQSSSAIRGSIAAWLHRTSVNRSLELVRSERYRRLREARAAQREVDSVDGDFDDSARLVVRVDQALAQLPEAQRALITEHFLCGRSQTDLARELGVNQSTVQRRIDKGLQRLRRRLQDEGAPAAAAGGLPMLLASLRQTITPDGLRQSLIKIGLSGVRDTVGSAAPAAIVVLVAKWLAAVVASAIAIAGAVMLVRVVTPPNPNATIQSSYSQLPSAVRATIEHVTAPQHVREIEQKRDLGRIVYDIDYSAGNRMMEIRVAEDGTLIWTKPSS
jgi:RNA polymerase sigma-70 factor (ECF subfamily)